MKVAIVNESLPYPPTAGNRIRTLNLMQRLAQRHQITYICRAADTEAETRLGIEYLRDHGISPIIADQAPLPKRGVRFYADLVGNLVDRRPYAVSAHCSPSLRRTIRQMAARGEADLWQFEWLAYADAVAGIRGVRSLLISHNIESLIWNRWYESETSRLKAFYLRQQWRKFVHYERRVFGMVSGVVCVSEPDARLALSEFSPRRVWVVDNGIDREFFEAAHEQRQPGTILFLGSLDWRPNLDAIRLLLDSIFPEVQREIPDARLCIVGRRPPQWLQQAVRDNSAISLHADVADVRQYLASATVMAVPLRIGGGSRLKILEAMACGLPVVSTPIGCEGLHVTPGRELTVSELDAFARALTWSIKNPETTNAMAETARKLAYERYDWNVLAQRLETTWEQVLRLDATPIASSVQVEPQPVMG